jgi:Zn-dependent protease
VTNVFLAIFNLIPVPPLDGGNVLAGFVPEPVARAIDQLRPYGFIILYGLLWTGFLSSLMDPIAERILKVLL